MNQQKKKRVLVIVAHPDDETLWMGGTLLRNKKKWDTKIICLTRKSDKDRYPKFLKVMKALCVKGFIYDLDDKNLDKPLEEKDVIKLIRQHSNNNYDMLFTHNSNGEYGHVRHLDVHKAVVKMLKNKILKARKVFLFSYHKVENKHQGYALYNSSADILIKLNSDELAMKRKLAVDVYGYNRGGIGFEENSCREIEAFDKFK